MSSRLFCFGLGFSAMALARNLMADGWSIGGTTRSPEKHSALQAEGIDSHLFDRRRRLRDPGAALAGITHLLISIPPEEAGDPVIDCHLNSLIAADTIVWVGYLSTTGVYGDRHGGWVDETDPPAPSLPISSRRVAAEAQWLESSLPLHVFRLAGIYGPGPGRNALASLSSGRARRVVKPGQVFSRIHVEDIVKVLRASIERPKPGSIYNVADNEPAPPQDVIAFAAKLMGLAPPPEVAFEDADLTAAARSFYAANRRVSNDRIRNELGVELTYPSYREGLKAIFESMARDRLSEAAGAETAKTCPPDQ